MNMRCITILSGGMDSAVMLWHLKKSGFDQIALTVDYGQRHRVEIDCARQLARECGISHRIADLSALAENGFFEGSSQTNHTIPVPEGHYAEKSMKLTVVPNRNMVLLAVAGALAVSTDSHHVAYGAHRGDHTIYPDCRPPFIEAMSHALLRCDFTPISLLAPFKHLTKAQIVGLGLELKVPFLSTHSCYKGSPACGQCGTCVERLEAFALAGAEDPIAYEDRDFWKTVTTYPTCHIK